ncbi:IPT/TIG domain-containing protein [Streptomyces pathocidini]|uniref:IPT/TIG domain-containing protein n=1 Tax=Streptomyces pathocidini TaxID=1650571 RepID=UPI0033DA5533
MSTAVQLQGSGLSAQASPITLQVDSITPAAGPAVGGNAVTIQVTAPALFPPFLYTISSVTFNGSPATIVGQSNVLFSKQVTVVAPPHPGPVPAIVPVVVTASFFPLGTGVGTGQYTYTGPPVPPTVLAINPTSGPTAGGTAFTITGADLFGATVTFGGVPATGVAVNAAGTEITGFTPPHAAGNVAVTVTTLGGAANVPGGFTYVAPPAPTATSIVPTMGPTTGGTPFTITGTNLTGTTSVTFNGVAATSVVVAPGGLSLTGVTPPGAAGPATVTVTTPGGAANVPGGFTYVPPVPPLPTAVSILPTNGPTTGGTLFIITGTNLTGGTVTFDGIAATVIVTTPTNIVGLTPAHAAGNVPVLVTTPGGVAAVPGGFTYVTQAPVANFISPNTGPAAGGTPFTIFGANLTGATVTFDGIPATGVVVDPSGFLLIGVTPPHAAGPVPVLVTTPGGVAIVPGGYTYF